MSSSQFLVMGATGQTGSKVAGMLLRRGHTVRVFVHKNDERSTQLQEQGAEIVEGDLFDFMTARSALEGVSGAYFVYPGAPGTVKASIIFAQAAKEAAVSTVVNMSMRPARREAKSHLAFNHWLAEQMFGWSGLAVTHLRPVFFAETLLLYSQGVKKGRVQLPYGEGKHAPIATEDIARLIVSILENPLAHKGQTYLLSGPQEYTYAEAFALIAEITGLPVIYEKIPLEVASEQWSKWRTPFEVQHVTEIVKDHAAGVFSGTDEVIKKFTGQEPMGLAEFIEKHLAMFA
jgi:NAD(P)H dehydrogenase (quinone)